ncbi:MAG TPA: hypothetical protein VFB01_15985 [Burkholderiales bacterium]|nr:hypothetical protein [Burkholderiales bacterium]
MAEDDLHALALIALLPLAALIVRRFGRKPGAGVPALLAFLLVFAVPYAIGPAYAFGPKIVSVSQVIVPALTAGACAAYLQRRWTRWIVNAAMLLIAMALSAHFVSMVAADPGRCAYAGNTDRYVSYRCNKPADAYPLWHTSFTGIYGLRPARPPG